MTRVEDKTEFNAQTVKNSAANDEPRTNFDVRRVSGSELLRGGARWKPE